MAALIDTKPDHVETYTSGKYRWYFTGGKEFLKLPIGSTYVVVHEPSYWFPRGRVIMYELMGAGFDGTWTKKLKERELTKREIAHFLKLAGRWVE
jgi:hypothetical protein